jgi:membrane associated rhomboid family serine protease
MIPLRDNIRIGGTPFVTYGIIGVNVLVFLFELTLGRNLQPFIHVFGMVPDRVTTIVTGHPHLILWAVLPLLTSLFLHGGWLHLLGNMLFLYIFGDNVEIVLGHIRYLVFYLACGVVASLSHVALNASSIVPTVGASGAIAGVLGAYFVLFPGARVVTIIPIFFFIQIVEVPAFLFLGIWFLLQFMSGGAALFASHNTGGVAWWAHIGGFVAGGLYVLWRYRLQGRRYRGKNN